MLTNFNSMITSIRKETERLRDNLINNTTSPPTNLSSLFEKTSLLLGKGSNSKDANLNSCRVNTALLRKRLEAGFQLDLTVDTRRANVRENYNYYEHDLRNEKKVKSLPKSVPNDAQTNLNSRRNKIGHERFTNFQIKTLNNLQDANSDLSLAEELFMAELKDEKNAKNGNYSELNNRRTSTASNHRDEIRRRLASGGESFDWKGNPTNLQVCFMNETASDDETEVDHTHQSLPCFDLSKSGQNPNKNKARIPGTHSGPPPRKIGFSQFLPTNHSSSSSTKFKSPGFAPRPPFWGEEDDLVDDEDPSDFFSQQAKLQGEARQALAAAREIAKLQLTQERIIRPRSPVAEMVANSLAKSGGGGGNVTRRNDSLTLPLSALPSRLTSEFLTGLNLNLAQLEVIVNDFHSHVEELNESLVSMLVERDDLNMEQDSMLVDVEDLTRYLAAKHNSEHQSLPLLSASQSILGKYK